VWGRHLGTRKWHWISIGGGYSRAEPIGTEAQSSTGGRLPFGLGADKFDKYGGNDSFSGKLTDHFFAIIGNQLHKTIRNSIHRVFWNISALRSQIRMPD
jgi:hypothetical protein